MSHKSKEANFLKVNFLKFCFSGTLANAGKVNNSAALPQGCCLYACFRGLGLSAQGANFMEKCFVWVKVS